MRGSHVIGTVLLGAIVFICSVVIAFLIVVLEYRDPLGTALIVAAPVAVLMLGFFIGSFYGAKARQERAVDDSVSYLRRSLKSAHAQRQKLEDMLNESEDKLISLHDRLKRFESDSHGGRDRKSAYLIEVDDLKARCASLQHHLTLRKERIADLQAELSIAQADVHQTRAEMEDLKRSAAEESRQEMWAAKLDKGSVKAVLESLVELEGVQTALIADDHGLVIESAGSDLHIDNMAAISGLVSSFTPHLKGIIPVDEVTSVTLGDGEVLALDTFYFDLLEMRCALTVARDPKHVYPGLAQEAIQRITVELGK